MKYSKVEKYAKNFIDNTTVIEQVTPILFFFWACWFAYFNSVETNDSLSGMRLLTTTKWSLLFLFMGAMKVAIILRGNVIERKLLGNFITIFWVLWSILLITSYTKPVGFVTYIVIALANHLSIRKIKPIH